MKVYISGPMTGIADFNFPMFDSLRDALVAQGHEVVSPADHDREVIKEHWGPTGAPENFPGYPEGDVTRYFDAVTSGGKFTLDGMLAWDITVIANDVDAIFMMPGWERSSGGRKERFVAESINLPVYLALEHYEPGPGSFHWEWMLDREQQRLVPLLSEAAKAAL